MSARVQMSIKFTALFGAVVVALALSFYSVERERIYRRLDATLQVATAATAMSAGHEMAEHSTQADCEADLRSVLQQTASADLGNTQILVRQGERNAAFKPGLAANVDLRTVPSGTLLSSANLGGLRIANRRFDVPRFSATYEIFAAEPTFG